MSQKYTKEFKETIVQLHESGQPVSDLAFLVLTGLLRQSLGYMIIVNLFLSQTLIEMSRNKTESLFGKQ